MDRDARRTALDFYFAAQEVERCLGLSPGAAQAKLRELCASGVVRSWWELPMGPPVQIKPSEWKSREVDLETRVPATLKNQPASLLPGGITYISGMSQGGIVVVSKIDLDQQIAEEDPSRDAEILRQLRKGLNPPKDIQWKKFADVIRKQCKARPGARGFSNERIENVTKELRKKFDQSV
jgi:hypothetical protein